MKKRILSIFIAVCMILPFMPVVSVYAASYTINGVTVDKNDGTSKNNCATYASQIQKKIWGSHSGTTLFNSKYNMLKNESTEERKITEEHVKEYIQAAPLGSRIRICNDAGKTANNYDNNAFGHTMILVAKDNVKGSFTTFESGNGIKEKTYTYKSFTDQWTTYKKTYNGKTTYGYYYFFYIADLTSTATKELTIIPEKYPTGTIKKGNSFALSGTIKSNKTITNVKGAIIDSTGNIAQAVELKECNTKNISIQNTALNKNLKFGTLQSGTYRLKYQATDASGDMKTWETTFTVSGKTKENISCDNGHTRGSYQYCEMAHPHANVYKCSVCGTSFKDGNTKYVGTCTICNPVEKNCDNGHTQGEYQYFEKAHPHAYAYKCAVCGEIYKDGYRGYWEECTTCNPQPTLKEPPKGNSLLDTSIVLLNGSKGTQVRYLQMNLNALGYSCGSVDSAFGNNTKNAVIKFQRDNGLDPDGKAGPATLSEMEDITMEVQKNLYMLGYYTGSIDGVMGSGTQSALKNFQKEYGYTQNGFATSTVRNALKQAVR